MMIKIHHPDQRPVKNRTTKKLEQSTRHRGEYYYIVTRWISFELIKLINIYNISSAAPPALPSASLMLANEKKSIPGGVFSNPFKEAEDAKMASLEKHVKMVMFFTGVCYFQVLTYS